MLIKLLIVRTTLRFFYIFFPSSFILSVLRIIIPLLRTQMHNVHNRKTCNAAGCSGGGGRGKRGTTNNSSTQCKISAWLLRCLLVPVAHDAFRTPHFRLDFSQTWWWRAVERPNRIFHPKCRLQRRDFRSADGSNVDGDLLEGNDARRGRVFDKGHASEWRDHTLAWRMAGLYCRQAFYWRRWRQGQPCAGSCFGRLRPQNPHDFMSQFGSHRYMYYLACYVALWIELFLQHHWFGIEL